MRDWLDMTLEEWGPASVYAIDALDKFKGSQEPKETGFGVAFGGQTIFEFLAKRPERAKVFGSAMGNFSKGVSHKVEYLVENYDWAALGEGTVVDVSVAFSLHPSYASYPFGCPSPTSSITPMSLLSSMHTYRLHFPPL